MPRGGRAIPSWSSRNKRSDPKSRPTSPPLGAVFSTVKARDLDEDATDEHGSAKITDFVDVASFNWVNRNTPTIIIPGKPPAWTPSSKAIRLQEDSGTYFSDINAARYPDHHLEPSVEAVLAMEPGFDTSSVDVFACGSTLGNLLRFVRHRPKPFRFLVEVIGNTVFFARREVSPTAVLEGYTGYGHSFPEAMTTWEPAVKGSESHQRVIQYYFGGLKFLVRFESDGYHTECVPTVQLKPLASNKTRIDEEAISSALSQSKITTTLQSSGGNGPLVIVHDGQKVPGSALLDIKTRAAHKKEKADTLDEEIPRLWVRQILSFVLAYHKNGYFDDIEVRDIRDDVAEWERKNQRVLQRLVVLLRQIVEAARGLSDGKLEVRYSTGAVLELRKQGDGSGNTLSSALMTKWLSNSPGGGESAEEGAHLEEDGLGEETECQDNEEDG